MPWKNFRKKQNNINTNKFAVNASEICDKSFSASLAKDWIGRIGAIDEGITHIILIADTISGGVVKQFQEKFNK